MELKLILNLSVAHALRRRGCLLHPYHLQAGSKLEGLTLYRIAIQPLECFLMHSLQLISVWPMTNTPVLSLDIVLFPVVKDSWILDLT